MLWNSRSRESIREAVSREVSQYRPRRRVPVESFFTGGITLRGDLYADLERPDGTPGEIMDRLKDADEQYLPLAVEGRHVLLNKSHVVALCLLEDRPDRSDTNEATVGLSLDLCLATKQTVRGTMRFSRPSRRFRALDFLNCELPRFVEVDTESGTMIINSEHIVSVSEVFE